jgi:hypothetical protein
MVGGRWEAGQQRKRWEESWRGEDGAGMRRMAMYQMGEKKGRARYGKSRGTGTEDRERCGEGCGKSSRKEG